MIRPALLLAALVLAGAAYLAAGPWLTLARIQDSLGAADPALLARDIDFPALRQHLRAQLAAALPERGGRATALTAALVERLVTPEGLARLAAGQIPQRAGDSGPTAPRPFATARAGYDTLDRFSVRVPAARGEIRFVLRRAGLTWRLTEMQLPLPGSGASG